MKQGITIITATLALAVIAMATALWLTYAWMGTLRTENAQLEEAIRTEEEQIRRVSRIDSTLTRLSSEQEFLDALFYTTGEESWLQFIGDMEELLRIAHIDGAVSVGDYAQGAGKPFIVDVRITKSTWPAVFHYLTLIDTFPGSVYVKRFQVTGAGAANTATANAEWSGTLQFELRSVRAPK